MLCPLNLSAIALPILRDEIMAAEKDPWPTLSFTGAVLVSPTEVFTEISVFSFSLYRIL